MAYIGNDLAVAYPNYRNIDDISASFNGSTTSFALLVNGAAPVPQPLNSQQCLISVGGVLQRPDDTGSEGFRLSGGNIIFSSAPATSEDFFGVVLAGADYVNAGANFPDGQVGAPSITFDQDNDTGFYRSGSGAVSFTSNGVGTATFGSASFVAPSFIPTSSTAPTNGVYLPAANSVAISTNSTERTRIDSSGRLLVGTSSASGSAFLQVQGRSGNTTDYAAFSLRRGSLPSGAGQALGLVSFTDNSENVGAQIYAESDAGSWTSGSNHRSRLVFSTTADGASSPTERMRIANGGNVSTFNTGGNGIESRNSTAAGTTVACFAGRHSATSTTDGTVSFIVYTNGNVTNTNGSYTTISDAKLKENIVNAGSQWDDLKAIQIRNWNFKAETGHETHRQIGPIAQELEAVCPGLVFETLDRDEDGNETGEVTKGVNQSVLYMKAVKALQEAMERIEYLEAEMEELKVQLS